MKECHFIWKPNEMLPKQQYIWDQETRQQSQMLRIVNHIENIRDITTKTGLIRSLKKFYKNLIEKAADMGFNRSEICNVFDVIPTTFILHSQFKTPDNHRFIKRFSDIELNQGLSLNESTPFKHCTKNMWLLKPATLNQGRGIEILSKIKEVQDCLDSQSHTNSFWVIQKYIERPLLFKERKFDIRVWALVTIGTSPQNMNLYFYKHGYLRTSSASYDLQNENKYVHLTNNCLQQKGEQYGQHEAGNTISFQDFQEYLDDKFPELHVSVEQHFIPRIKDVIIDTYLSVKQDLNPGKRKTCFELLGYDFLVDEDFRLWLLEVNQNPYLGTPNQYISTLLPQMVKDLMNLVVDPYVSAPLTNVHKNENNFELIHSHDESVNQRRSYSIDFLYPIPQKRQVIGVEKKREILTQRKAKYQLQQEIRIKLAFKLNKPAEEKTRKASQQPYDTDAYAEIKKKDDIKKYFHRKAYPSLNEQSLLSIEQKIHNHYQTPTAVKKEEQLNNSEILQKNQSNYIKRVNYEKDLYQQAQNLANVMEMILPENQFDQLFQQIFSRLSSWELFNQKQIEKALKALDVLSTQRIKPLFRNCTYYQKLIQLGCNEQAPSNIREKIMEMIEDHSKVLLKRQFMLELPEQLYQLGKILQDQQQQDKQFQLKVYSILLNLLSIDKSSGKMHIPGYTKELRKLRQLAINRKLLLFFLSLFFLGTMKDQIEEDVLNSLQIDDIHYQLSQDGIQNAHVEVVNYLEMRLKKMREDQFYVQEQERIQRQKLKLKEEQERMQFLEQKELKRKMADESLQKRLDNKKRMIMEEKKKQEKELELQERELAEKRRLKEEERKQKDQIWKYKQKMFNEIGDLKQFRIYQPVLKKNSPVKVSQSISVPKDENQFQSVEQIREQRNLSTFKKPNERSYSDVMGQVDNLMVFSSQKFSPRNNDKLQSSDTDYQNKQELYLLESLSKNAPNLKPYRQKLIPEFQEIMLKNAYPDHPYIKKRQKSINKMKQKKIKLEKPEKTTASFIQVYHTQEKKVNIREANRASSQDPKLPSIENQKQQIVTQLTQVEHMRFMENQKEQFAQRSFSLNKRDTAKQITFKKVELSPLLNEQTMQLKLGSVESGNFKSKNQTEINTRKIQNQNDLKIVILSSSRQSVKHNLIEDSLKDLNKY